MGLLADLEEYDNMHLECNILHEMALHKPQELMEAGRSAVYLGSIEDSEPKNESVLLTLGADVGYILKCRHH